MGSCTQSGSFAGWVVAALETMDVTSLPRCALTSVIMHAEVTVASHAHQRSERLYLDADQRNAPTSSYRGS